MWVVFMLMGLETGVGRAANPIEHRFLKCGCGSGSIAIVAKDGSIEWEFINKDEISDAWVLANGNIIFSFKAGLREITPQKTTVWEYKAPAGAEVHSCQPLPGDHFLVGESHNEGKGELYEMDRQGQKHKTITIQGSGNAHSQFRQVRKTPQGTYLVTYQRAGGKAMEYDADGKLLRTFPSGRFVAIRLPEGNTLIACGDEHRVIEVDTRNNIVWEIKENDLAGIKLGFIAGLQRLPNGNTIICNWQGHSKERNYPQILEVTRDKKVVWQVLNPRLSLVSSVLILDPDCFGPGIIPLH
jgi:hypothetical protein